VIVFRIVLLRVLNYICQEQLKPLSFSSPNNPAIHADEVGCHLGEERPCIWINCCFIKFRNQI
jgi:hypothetical protein